MTAMRFLLVAAALAAAPPSGRPAVAQEAGPVLPTPPAPGDPEAWPDLAPDPDEAPPAAREDGPDGALGAAPPGDHHPDGPAETESLDRLFEALADAEGADPAFLQRRIGELWSRSGSDSMDLLLARGREAMDEEAFDKAVDHLDALTRLAPDFAEGWNARATAHFLRRDYWASVADIQRTLAIEPRHFGALAGLGIILEQTGDEAGALAAHREALRLNPHLEGSVEAAKRLAPVVDGRDI
jgi:tetratricopeptide (TPR) repeat protein